VKRADRIEGLLDDLRHTLVPAAELVDRGHTAFDGDVALRLAFEALSNRVGEVTKQLVHLDPDRLPEPEWSLASRHRDKVVHHYNSVNADRLWSTVTTEFPRLLVLAMSKEGL